MSRKKVFISSEEYTELKTTNQNIVWEYGLQKNQTYYARVIHWEAGIYHINVRSTREPRDFASMGTKALDASECDQVFTDKVRPSRKPANKYEKVS